MYAAIRPIQTCIPLFNADKICLLQVPSSRLITSYPIPPQSVFTCSPCSTRWRVPKSRDASRYTYISTRGPKPSVTLFKDVLGATGDTTSTTVTEKVDHTSRIVHLSTTSAPITNGPPKIEDGASSDLIAIFEDGTVTSLDGETLRKKWATSPEILRQDLPAVSKESHLQVELAQSALAGDIVTGFFGGKQEAFAAFLRTSHGEVPAQDMLVLVTKVAGKEVPTRYLHVLGIVSAESQTGGRLIQIHTSPIPTSSAASRGPGSLRLDVNSGSLIELLEDALVTYDLTTSIVRTESTLQVPEITSFLRLSKSSVLAATSKSLDVYNPIFQSLQASIPIDLDLQMSAINKEPMSSSLSLVAYFARLEIAVAVHGISLVAVQLEAPRTRGKKRRAEGLLIDAIGRGIPQHRDDSKKLRTDIESARFSTSFSSNLPGSVSGSYWSQFRAEADRADELLGADDLPGLEEFLAPKFGLETKPAEAVSGEKREMNTVDKAPKLPQWTWPVTPADYPLTDRRWVLFTISRVFTWRSTVETDTDESRLLCKLPESNLLTLLIDAGHLTVSNFKSAFKEEVRGIDDIDYSLGEAIPQVLVDVDLTFSLLLSYLSHTKLGAVELLAAIRLIMRSLELIQDPTKIAPKLLTFEPQHSELVDPDESAFQADQSAIGHELERAEQELEAIEHFHLGEGSMARGSGLSVAFGKLGSCPRLSTIRVLRRSYKPEEILSLIYVLRMELVRDGWTARYLDTTRLDEDEELEAPPDGSISLIADLLCRCIDAVGPGGWLINDAIVAAGAGDHMDSADFLASLKLEVSAALEGVQEAVFMRGIISEFVRYGKSVQKAEGESGQKHRRGDGTALVLHGQHDKAAASSPGWTESSTMLPLGLKAKARISAEKVISGGEIARRRRREVGHLVSQKVGAYSLERISI